MKQSRGTSFIKSVTSTAVGFVVSFVAQLVFLPILGVQIELHQNTIFAVIMTVISVGRGFIMERIFEALGWRLRMSAFVMAVLAELQRQRDAEGYDLAHDLQHTPREIASAGAAYLIGLAGGDALWPWSDGFKPDVNDTRRDLVRGGALALASGELCDIISKRPKVRA